MKHLQGLSVFLAVAATALLGPWTAAAMHTVAITAGPEGTVSATEAELAFTSTEPTTFTCVLDNAQAVPCGQPGDTDGAIHYQGVGPGVHRFRVLAYSDEPDDVASADRSWLVEVSVPPGDRTAPETRLVSALAGPVLRDGTSVPLEGTVPLDTATLTFEATEPGTFACTLDGVAGPCFSPVRYARLPPGEHRFEVTAIDLAGNRDESPASRSWTVGVVPARVESNAHPLTPVRQRLVTAADLLTLGREHRPRKTAAELSDEQEEAFVVGEPGDDDCQIVACLSPAEGSVAVGGPPGTPALVSGPYIVSAPGNDPNIAASRTHLIMTSGKSIRFFRKSGQPLTTDKNGNPFPSSLSSAQFFKWFFDPADPNNLNTIVNLPAGLNCDPTIYPWGNYGTPWGGGLSPPQQAATADCLQEVYDTRVIFDEYRNRFWILAAVRNHLASVYKDKSDLNQRVGRRDLLLLAVSLTEDPRDGWWMYPWLGAAADTWPCTDIGDAPGPPPACPGSPYRPGDGGDYPSLGITPHWVVVTINASQLNPFDQKNYNSYTVITGAQADPLANGGCVSTCGWHYGRSVKVGLSLGNTVLFNFDPYADTAQPAVQHAQPHDWALLASHPAGYNMAVVLGFRASEGLVGPPIHAVFVPVNAVAANVNDMPQRPSAPVTAPAQVLVTNLGTIALKAAARNRDLYVTWQDCKAWEGAPACITSVRFVALAAVDALESSSLVTSAFRDRTFGLRNAASDPVGAVVSYGNAAVEVNGVGDSVLVYNRSGPEVFLEARYSAFMHNEPDIRPSAVLAPGSFPAGSNSTSSPNFNMDTGGIGLDPMDGLGIWMAHGFARKSGSSGVIDFAIGKVFGRTYPDLVLFGGKLLHLLPATDVRAGGRLRVHGLVANDGDGTADGVEVQATLRSPGERIFLGGASLGSLGPGTSRDFKLDVRVPAALVPGEYTLEVAVSRLADEYSGENNAVERAVSIGPPRRR